MEKKSSVGVIIFGVILILWGVLSSIGTLIDYFVVASYAGRSYEGPAPSVLKYMQQFLYCIFLIILGFGLIKLKEWARKSALFIFAPLFVIILPFHNFFMFVYIAKSKLLFAQLLEIVRIILGVATLYLFTRPKVKEQFKQGPL